MKILQVAVWGLGRHALKNIIPALQNCPGINFYGVCSRNNDTVSKTVLESGCKGWTKYEEMLEDGHVDVVYLATPIALHHPQGKAVLLASKHLWCEKPLAQNLAQAEELLELSKAMNISIAEGFMYLYHPQFLQLQEIVRTGKLGIIQGINCRFGIPPLDQPGFRNTRELGGGAFLDVGSYPVSAIISLFPDPEADVLFSEINTISGSSVDTAGRAVLRVANMNIMLDWSTISSYRNEIDIWGTEGSVSTSRIFSKSSGYLPCFRFTDVHGNESKEECTANNHFLEMFKVFHENTTDKNKIEKERQMILCRARLMNKIQKFKICREK
jgi:predicted dehydrogenase